MFEYDEIQKEIEQLKVRVHDIGSSICADSLENELKSLEEETTRQEFWEDTTNSSKTLAKITEIKKKLGEYRSAESSINTISEMIVLIKEENDEDLAKEVIKNLNEISKKVDELEVSTLLSNKYDENNAIITIHPGAGGTEAQDWAEMLYRMYTRWANKNNYEVKELDYLDGEEAGLKSVTFEIIGENAYGYMKCEMGVHRLVRISPFDSGGRRHTSFASIEVLPEITDDIEIEINPDDLRIDTYRASRSRRTAYK